MKSLTDFIRESLLNDSWIDDHIDPIETFKRERHRPKTKQELEKTIYLYCHNIAHSNEADLNWIDVTGISDMRGLFNKKLNTFNGDISGWDVSNVKNMADMFKGSFFNGDISGWDVSNVTNMDRMFQNSSYNRDLSNWNISDQTSTNYMFDNSKMKNLYGIHAEKLKP